MKSSFLSFGRYLKQTVSLQVRETTLGHISNVNKALFYCKTLGIYLEEVILGNI